MWSSGAAPDNDNGKGKYDDRNQIDKKDETKSTHFISIPIALNSIDIQQSFKGFRETILGDKNLDVVNQLQLNRGNFTFSSMLHLTCFQLDLIDETKLSKAKSMMKELENEFQQIGSNLEIAFKGLKTPAYLNPASAQALFAEIDSSKNNKDSYDSLRKIVHRLVEECLERGLLTK